MQTHEWPILRQREVEEPNFRLFIIATTKLDNDDELKTTYNLVNDPRTEALLPDASASLRDTVLTRLSDAIAKHAQSLAPPAAPRAPEHTATSAADTPPAIVDLRVSVRLNPGLHGVPEQAPRFVEPVECDGVIRRLTTTGRTAITGLRGEGGSGKTTLAAAVARRAADRFPGGVHRVTIGENATTEDVRRLQYQFTLSLGDDDLRPPRDHLDGASMLAAALQPRQALVVIDDVWHPWQAHAFDVWAEGSPSRMLFTSRFAESLPAASESVDIGRLTNVEATMFLRQIAPELPSQPDGVARVLDASGGLRLALAVLAAVSRARGWSAVIDRSDDLAVRFGHGDDASAAHKALQLGVESLDMADRDHLWDLAAFPADERVPASVLARLWSLGHEQVGAWMRRLSEVELIIAVDAGLELHDHVHDFLDLESERAAENVHLRLWEMAGSPRGGDWAGLAEAEPYLWNRLIWHGTRAGLNHRALIDTVGSVDWLVERMTRQGSAAAEQDIRAVVASSGLPPDAALARMQRVLRHGGLFDGLPNNDDARASVSAWASTIGLATTPDRPAPATLISGSLPVPSDALVRTIRGHTNGVLGIAFSPAGHHIATASLDGTARLWDTTTGETVLVLALACSGRVAWHGNLLAVTAGWHWAVLRLNLDPLGPIGPPLTR